MRINTEEINRNREVVEKSYVEDSTQPAIEDGDADYGQRLYGKLPTDKLGFLPPNAKGEK